MRIMEDPADSGIFRQASQAEVKSGLEIKAV
jgi:hypothetical protein